MTKSMKVLILAGGKGTRLWPISRENLPKQFIKFFDDRSLFEMTVRRAMKITGPENVYIVTSKEYEGLIKAETLKVNKKMIKNIILEPEGKNTLPAVLLGCHSFSDEDVFVVMPSDHFIKSEPKFTRTLKRAAISARQGNFLTIGIKPKKPETGFGYIEADYKRGSNNIVHVKKFVEKPSLEKAKKYLAEGTYYWNSGIFVFRKKEFIEAVKKHEPVLYKYYLKGVVSFMQKYNEIPSQSIDFGVMERVTVDSVRMVKADFEWSDMGSFDAVYEAYDKDSDHNVKYGKGDIIAIDSKNSIFLNGERLLVTVGIDDLIFVDTEDAVLMMKKGSGQKIKEVYNILKKNKKKELSYQRTGYRPWGSYTVLLEGKRYKIKKITVNPGATLSLQMHYHRSEHWVVLKGTARVTLDNKTFFVHENESIYIPKSGKHRLENPGKDSLEIIEVQNGEYVDEDDIIRFDDLYGRS